MEVAVYRRITKISIVACLFAGSLAWAQDPYLRPSIGQRAAMADESGALPQLNMAMTNANVVDVRTGDILEGVTVVIRDGMIVSVGNGNPPRGAEVVDMMAATSRPGCSKDISTAATSVRRSERWYPG